MNYKALAVSTLAGTLLLGGNALAQDSAYEFQKSIGANLDIFKLGQAVVNGYTLEFGDSQVQYRSVN